MLTAQFQRQGTTLCGVRVSGHAGYAAAGNDIVCAAVSASVMLTANNITDIFRIPADVVQQTDTITIRLLSESADGSRLLSGLLLQLEQIQEEFPGRLKLKFTEV